MKKFVAVLLACVMLACLVSAHAAGKKAEQGKYDCLKVGNTTPFSGNFLDDALGSNLADQDVRSLIHGYSLVRWNADEGKYEFNLPGVAGGATTDEFDMYTFSLSDNLTYNDGTPITAKDYAFTLLLLGSPELKEATGGQGDISRILGGRDYQDGKTKTLSGFELKDDGYSFSVRIDPSYIPYFYDLKVLDIMPLPISVIAPGCSVQKDRDGKVSISGPFTAELLKQTLLDPETGYISHPSVTSGPYQLKSYDGDSVTLELNSAFIGDADGEKPTIPQIIIRETRPDALISSLNAGELDLVVRCVRQDQIRSGMALPREDIAMKSYMRAGLSFISFCAEKGPTADVNVRRALAMCMDKEMLTRQYNGGFGTPVNGYYGIGQWMFRMANGAILQEEGDESDWSDLQISRIAGYALDADGAGELLDQAGWNLDGKGNAYSAETGGIRYRNDGSSLAPLKLKLIVPEENGAADLLKNNFIDNLTQAGVELEISKLPWEQLLELYYNPGDRDCDMILLGTNFGDVFDPSGEYDGNGTSKRNGITDPKLAELAAAMRSTEPGNAPEYCRRWLAYLEERSDVAAEIPIYSDAYLDFHTTALQDYEPAPTGSWAIAIQNAYLSDVEPEAEEDEEPEESTESGTDEDDEY
ncbi:MAG: ABC transporter substrate-binding protein [Clostridiales bacterium]|nr:ABC transporter substrate-binding protein [Clostridiales bacterium]